MARTGALNSILFCIANEAEKGERMGGPPVGGLWFGLSIVFPDFREFPSKIILSDGAHSAPSDFFTRCDETLRHVATFAWIPWPGMSCHDVTFA